MAQFESTLSGVIPKARDFTSGPRDLPRDVAEEWDIARFLASRELCGENYRRRR